VNGIGLAQADRIISGALSEARRLGLAPVAVAVLDAGGHLTAFAREDGAAYLRSDIAVGKAWGALGMGIGTRSLSSKSPEFLAALASMTSGRIVPSPGGVLVLDDDQVVGAVGISGDTGERDEMCAVAGIVAVELRANTG
jgi:uncharacterized protein GlcG (DUF336 family)